MKKIFVIILSALSLVTFVACGTDYAKITGIRAGIINFGVDGDSYRKDCVDDSTLTDNDYLVKVGERYQIVIQLTCTGGSIIFGYASAESVKIIYDDNLMTIGEPGENLGYLYYPLVCQSEFTCAAILIEDGEYHTEVIVSAIT